MMTALLLWLVQKVPKRKLKHVKNTIVLNWVLHHMMAEYVKAGLSTPKINAQKLHL